jgi:hypothetical protein
MNKTPLRLVHKTMSSTRNRMMSVQGESLDHRRRINFRTENEFDHTIKEFTGMLRLLVLL